MEDQTIDITTSIATMIVCCAFLAGVVILIVGSQLEKYVPEDSEDQKSKPC